MSSVCVVGSFMMDLAVRAPRRPNPGETLLGSSFEMFLGGKGFNQAIAAARCGARTAMIGRLGDDDYGRRFREAMAAEGIDSSGVSTDERDGTGIGAPLIDDSGENSIVIVPRANARLTPADIDRSLPVIAAADVLLLQLELSIDVALAAARAAKSSGRLVVLNPAPALPREVVDRFRGIIDVLVPNEVEARALNGAHRSDSHGNALALSEWLETSVVLTAGRRGCIVAEGGEELEISAHEVPVVDTVGAGDAFCGALGSWLGAGASLSDAVRHANAAGALAVTRSGAEPAMPSRESIVELVNSSTPLAGSS